MATSNILRPRIAPGLLLGLISLLPVPQADAEPFAAKAVDLQRLPSLEQIVPRLDGKRAIFVGETHDKYSHHLAQLAIIRAIHQRHPDLAIGMEFFQQPFQEHLDAFVAGRIDETTMLRRTGFLENWGFDYRLYRPILQYARDHRIPLVALNVPRSLVRKVAAGGLASLSPEEKAALPEIDRSDADYRERLRATFESHPTHEKGTKGSFDNFFEAQLLWDEGMAAKAAEYLQEHPGRRMVILAGSGHLAYGDGIPRRLQRRLKVESTIVLNEPEEVLTPDLADVVLFPTAEPLPPKGMMGVLMVGAEQGVRIAGFTDTSAAQAVGVEQGDRIVAIDNESVATPADVELALLDRKPGETVEMGVARQRAADEEKLLKYRIELR